MSLVQTRQLDHGERALSNEAASASERENRVRYPGPGQPHVESHFLKANSPDGQRAIWIKHTLLVPTRGPAMAELWAIAFSEGGRKKRALKRSFPIAAARFASAPFRITVPDAELSQGAARGAIEQAEAALRWDLRFEMPTQAFLPFPYPRMYSGGFPRNKTLTPAPDTRVSGEVTAWGERWQLCDWRGAQGHNWGPSHAEAYAWAHANAMSPTDSGPLLTDTWLEALTGRVRIGPVVLPWLSVAALSLEGRLFRFDGLSALLSRQVAIDARSYRFTFRQGDARLTAELSADAAQFAGLRYEDPDGRALSCLNSKLARGVFRLETGGRTHVLHTSQAALELGTRSPHHGIRLLA